MDDESDVCLFSEDIQDTLLILVIFTFGITALAVILGHAGSAFPSSQIGNRPMGNGLISYLINHVITGIGVKGYDSSLGAFAPPIRLMLHFAGFLIFYAGGIFFLSLAPIADIGSNLCWKTQAPLAAFPIDFIEVKNLFVSSLFLMHLMIYLIAWMIYFHFSNGVSHPGGPREHKIRRTPKWENKTTLIDENNEIKSQWRCDVSHESHKVTNDRFQEEVSKSEGKSVFSPASPSGPGNQGVPIKVGLSGEPDGRQIWSRAKPYKNSKKSEVDKDLVEIMAFGGRKKGFNADTNPNR